MASSVYCFVSGGEIHCVPVNSFNGGSNESTYETPVIQIDRGKDVDSDDSPAIKQEDETFLSIKKKNLLYTLNNPSLSDLDSDSGEVADQKSDYISDVLNNYSAHALFFSTFSIDLQDNLSHDYNQIKLFLQKIFSKTWKDKNFITVKRLTGGITNMLLKCTYTVLDETVLMRVYGPGTNLIIDRHREFILHLVLNSMDLAPPVHARFKNGLIYGFLGGRSLEPFELKLPSLYPLIAQQLGNWHSKVDIEEVHKGVNKLREYTRAHTRKLLDQSSRSLADESIKRDKKLSKKKYIRNIWELIEDWIEIVPIIPQLLETFQENCNDDVTEDNIRDLVKNEFLWAKEAISKKVKSAVVSSHCDLLSGNIIIPNEELINKPMTKLPDLKDNPIKFIDYEYMLPAPRGFDIANHLAEWQGFDCDRSAIPEPSVSNPTLVKWVTSYLNKPDATDEEVEGLIQEIYYHYGLPGFYWGIWAAIQSEISNIDFSYADYSKLRLQEYWDWKNDFLKKN